MKLENQESSSRTLLGYFMFNGSYSGCLIVDWFYCVESLNYPSGDEEEPQIIIPNNVEWAAIVPKYYELGYIPAGVYPSIELRHNLRYEEEGIPEYVDIPVYAIYKSKLFTSIFIEIDEWMPALEISEEELKVSLNTEKCNDLENKTYLNRQLFGGATATGGGIVICDMDFVRMCQSYHDCISNQIIVPPDGEVKGFRVGVVAHIPPELQDKEFIVYGEYEGDWLKRICIEISNATYIL